MLRGKRAREYDIIIIGSGAGANIIDAALGHGMKVALVDKGPLGGTCLNVGCIPSKMLIFPADRIMEIREAHKLGVVAEIQEIDFGEIMRRMRRMVDHDRDGIREGIRATRQLAFYEVEGHFVDAHTLEVGDRQIRGERIFVAAGARPHVPPIEGLDQVPYLDNETVLNLEERPESITIVGGGYIAAEYSHFFAAMGTRVTLLQRNVRLVPEEEPEISDLLRRKLSERMEVVTRTEVVRATASAEGVTVVGRDVRTGQTREFTSQHLMLAAGRVSNADRLRVANAGIETDERGYIKVNEYLETNVEGIWAFGDITGNAMFRHVANYESSIVWHNSVHGHKVPVDLRATPHAVFSHPQIASVGLTEAQAKGKHDILVGEARYLDVAKGVAMIETEGFAKAIVDRSTGNVLGFHIIGPHAAILIQEVVNAMAANDGIDMISRGMHIHPALPELVLRALYNLREPR